MPKPTKAKVRGCTPRAIPQMEPERQLPAPVQHRHACWLTSPYAQWSPDRLYGSERLTLGGESSVRGFKEQYLSGDNGGYWRNELGYYSLFTLPVIGAGERNGRR